MKIKITVRYHLSPIRMAVCKQTRNKQALARIEEKENLIHFWWEHKVV